MPPPSANQIGRGSSPGKDAWIWTLPGQGRSLGLWQAPDIGGMNAILASLPLTPG